MLLVTIGKFPTRQDNLLVCVCRFCLFSKNKIHAVIVYTYIQNTGTYIFSNFTSEWLMGITNAMPVEALGTKY